MSNFTEPLNNLVKDGEQYVNAQMDSLKLHSIKGLSMGLSTVASLLLIFILGSVLLLALSFALVMWLGQLLGSYVLSAFIVAGVLFIALVNSSGVISSMLFTPYLASTVSSITPVLFNSVCSSL